MKFMQAADLGCGTGGQTMVLSQNISGKITGVDICPKFIDVLNDNTKKLNLQERVKGITGKHPAEVEKFWTDAGSKLDTIEYNISVMQKSGYSFISAFTLPENCWMNYFNPRAAANNEFLKKYPGNKTLEEYIKNDNYEKELYLKYNQYYGYVFYIGKKI